MKNLKEHIADVAEEIVALLYAKNDAYGNSASEPLRIFSKVDNVEQINVRIDDKLSRLARGAIYGHEDTEQDLIGYLILKKAVLRHNTNMAKSDHDAN